MENFQMLFHGFTVVLSLQNIGACLLGAVLGLVVGVCFVCFVSYGLTFLSTLPSCQDFITKTMFLTDDSVWTFSKCIYQYNVVGALFELYL